MSKFRPACTSHFETEQNPVLGVVRFLCYLLDQLCKLSGIFFFGGGDKVPAIFGGHSIRI